MSILKLKGNASGTGTVTLEAPNTNTDQTIAIPDGAGSFVTANASGDVAVTGDLTVDTDTLYVDSANNRVGVGTISPASPLHIKVATNENVRFSGGSGDTRILALNDAASLTTQLSLQGDPLLFRTTGGTEAARIDSSGNLLVGKNTTNTATAGLTVYASGQTAATQDSSRALIARRIGSEGEIFLLQTASSDAAVIGTSSLYPYFGNKYSSGGAGLHFVSTNIRPFNAYSGTSSDNVIDLGTSVTRFDDIYATNPTIQTSDATEKQDIASLTDTEITAAKAISKLFKTFKWKDKVAEKGDAARTHSGVIAQDVQQAMTDAGLDAGDYAFFIRGVWWETQTEVPAVDEVVDEDGNVITEAQEAYTRTDTYATLEEAPEGATERTRLGIRYPELLAFIGAATEQRLASIEARLDALEAV